MLEMPITFDDLAGNEVTRTFNFHLSPAAVIELNVAQEDDLETRASKLVAKKDAAGLIDLFKDLVRRSYGVKDEDGITFVQSDELSLRFTQTDAYSKLFLLLMGDAQQAVNFMRGIMPKKIQEALPDNVVDLEQFKEQLPKLENQAVATRETPGSEPVLDGGTPDTHIWTDPAGQPEGLVQQPDENVIIGQTLPSDQEQPAWVTENRVPSYQELQGAPPELLQLAFARKMQTGQ